MLEKTAYCAIRRDHYTGFEWMDLSTITLTPEDTKKEASLAELYPGWSKDNPVLRIAKILIKECSA